MKVTVPLMSRMSSGLPILLAVNYMIIQHLENLSLQRLMLSEVIIAGAPKLTTKCNLGVQSPTLKYCGMKLNPWKNVIHQKYPVCLQMKYRPHAQKEDPIRSPRHAIDSNSADCRRVSTDVVSCIVNRMTTMMARITTSRYDPRGLRLFGACTQIVILIIKTSTVTVNLKQASLASKKDRQ